MIEELGERVNADTALVRRGRFLSTTFLLEIGVTQWLVSIVEGHVGAMARDPFVMPSWSFALRASDDEWTKFWSEKPQPGSHDLMALIKRRTLKVEGDVQVFMSHLRYFKEALAKLRVTRAAA